MRIPAALPMACCLAALAQLASPDARAAVLALDGQAQAADGDRLLYREEHLLRGDADRPTERLVLYRCPDGTAFARKRIDYRASAIAPDFDLVDARGHREGLRRDAGTLLVWSGAKPPRPLRAGDGTLVADAGFDAFVLRAWPQLVAGKAQPLAFVVPAFGRSLPFEIRGLGARGAGEAAVQRFELRLAGVMGKVVAPISVEYGIADRRLHRFAGLSDIRDARGQQIRARIAFPRAPRPVDAQRWDAAAALPLATCTLGR